MQHAGAVPETESSVSLSSVAPSSLDIASNTIPFPGPLPAQFPAPAAPSFDPVALTVLAVNRLAPATLRTSTHGKALKVIVPDRGVGEVFRAALEQMRMTRGTDRLIEIVVEGVAADEIGDATLPPGRAAR